MSVIIRYIINMSPYMIISIPIYIIVRFIILKFRKNINWYHEIGLFIFSIFVIGLTSQTIIPKIEITNSGINVVTKGVHTTNLIPFKVLIDTYNQVFNGNINALLINFLGNIIMFIPIGFFIKLLFKISDKRTIFIGFCSSLFIETTQLFLKRGTDVDDLMLNTIGVILGVLLYKLLCKKFNSLTKYKNNN